MKNWKSLIALACCTVFAIGCESNPSTNTTTPSDTQTGTDAAATTDTAASTDDVATTGDTTAGTDATTAGTDATTAGTDAGNCPGWYEMPATDPGCTGTADKTFIGSLAEDETAADDFANIIRSCTLTKGCLAKTCETDKIECISKCVQTEVESALTYQCSFCYGTYSGYCGFNKCLAVCATDTPDCAPCLKANCDVKREACRDKGENPGL